MGSVEYLKTVHVRVCMWECVLVYGGYTLGKSSLLVPVYPVSPADETHYRAMGDTLTLCAKIAHWKVITIIIIHFLFMREI